MERVKFNRRQIEDLKAAGFDADDGGSAGADNCQIEVTCYDGKLRFEMCLPNGNGDGHDRIIRHAAERWRATGRREPAYNSVALMRTNVLEICPPPRPRIVHQTKRSTTTNR